MHLVGCLSEAPQVLDFVLISFFYVTFNTSSFKMLAAVISGRRDWGFVS